MLAPLVLGEKGGPGARPALTQLALSRCRDPLAPLAEMASLDSLDFLGPPDLPDLLDPLASEE